ncbi:MAG: hypothetical protein AAF390_04575 [Pseudomonadota bacterium]
MTDTAPDHPAPEGTAPDHGARRWRRILVGGGTAVSAAVVLVAALFPILSDRTVRNVEEVSAPAVAPIERVATGPVTPPALPVAPAAEDAAVVPPAPACDVTAKASAEAGAMLALEIRAPCDPLRRVEVVQGALRVAVVTDAEGRVALDVPALTAAPRLSVWVDGRDMVRLSDDVPDFARFARTVVHWDGPVGLELHAFENDAAFGSPGHVHAHAPRTMARAVSGRGGAMVILGDPAAEDARMAAIYTRPRNIRAVLSVEAPVISDTCGTAVSGGTIVVASETGPVHAEIELTMPPCDAIGGSVVLGAPVPGEEMFASN